MRQGKLEALIDEMRTELEDCDDDAQRLALSLPFVLQVADAERGFVLMRQDGVDLVVATHNLDAHTLWNADVSQTILGRTMEGEAIVSDNAVQDKRFIDSNSILISALRAVMCLPFRMRGKTVGAIYLDNRFQRGAFNQRQLDAASRLLTVICGSLQELH